MIRPPAVRRAGRTEGDSTSTAGVPLAPGERDIVATDVLTGQRRLHRGTRRLLQRETGSGTPRNNVRRSYNGSVW